jgi:hypothetical protein
LTELDTSESMFDGTEDEGILDPDLSFLDTVDAICSKEFTAQIKDDSIRSLRLLGFDSCVAVIQSAQVRKNSIVLEYG